MKTRILLSAVLVLAVWSARADFIPYSSSPNVTIPDANVVGVSDSITVNDFSYSIDHVDVHLNISGGYNGDLYGYLVFDSAESGVVNVRMNLLNRPGDGLYQDAGLNVILSDGATPSIHDYGGAGQANTGSPTPWGPDGGDLTLGSLSGDRFGIGTWTLFLADMANNDVLSESSLVTWGVDLYTLTPIPEPTTWAGIIFFGLFGGTQLVRKIQKRKL